MSMLGKALYSALHGTVSNTGARSRGEGKRTTVTEPAQPQPEQPLQPAQAAEAEAEANAEVKEQSKESKESKEEEETQGKVLKTTEEAGTTLLETKERSAAEAEAPELKLDIDPAPSLQQEKQEQQQQQQYHQKRPQGKGRPRRFSIKTNTPFIQQPTPKGKIKRSASIRGDDKKDKDEIVSSVQVPDHITLDPSFLHTESEPEPEAKPKPAVPVPKVEDAEKEKDASKEGKEDDNKDKQKRRPPSLKLVEDETAPTKNIRNAPATPDRRPRPIQLDNDNATTLYHVLTVVNNALAAEMKKNRDVHKALSEDLRGPLNLLGLLGQLVRLLFRSMLQHRKKYWRNKKIAAGLGQPLQSEHVSSPAPFRGALSVFSVPVRHYAKPPSKPEPSTNKNGHESDSESDGGRDERFSALEPGIAKRGEDNSSGDEYDVVWRAIQRNDRHAAKRNHESFFSDDDSESDSSCDSDDDDVSDIDYLNLPSPSLPAFDKDGQYLQDDFNPRRHKTSTIKEQRKEEAEEDRKSRRESRAARRRAKAEVAATSSTAGRQMQEQLQKQAQQEAAAAFKKQLAQLADERDAALFLAERATYERDTVEAEREALGKDSEQLRRLLQSFVDDEFPGDVEGEGVERKEKDKEKAEDGEKSVDPVEVEKPGEEVAQSQPPTQPLTPTRPPPSPLPSTPTSPEFRRGSSRRSSRSSCTIDYLPRLGTPLPPLTPYLSMTPASAMSPTTPTVPPTPSTPMAEWDRQRLVEEARRILHEQAHPPTPLSRQYHQRPPPPTLSSSRPDRPSRLAFPETATAYRIIKTRAPIGYGFVASMLDVFLAVGLMIARQKHNFRTGARWFWFVFVLPAFLFLEQVFSLLVVHTVQSQEQRQLYEPQARSQEGHPVREAFYDKPSTTTTATTTAEMPSTQGTAVTLRTTETQLALHTHLRRVPYIRFPRDALAELLVFHFVVFSGFVLASAVAERNLWLDANANTADAPAHYLHNFVLQYRRDTDSCTTLPSSPLGQGLGSPYHFCTCVPTLVDTRMVTLPAAYLWEVWRDRAQDYLRLISMWMAWGLHEFFSPRS